VNPAVLSVEGYTLDYETAAGPVRALDGVTLSVRAGEVLGLVGESGSGKSTLAFAVMRDLAGNAVERAGHISLSGRDLMTAPPDQIDAIRGRDMAMVFQDPATSLNPTMTLGAQLSEVYVRHHGHDWPAARRAATGMMESVGLKDPTAMMARYPHEVSGGEKQRILIGQAFAARPACILLDEPTTALDVITAQQVLGLFRKLQAESGVACLYISHDLALVGQIAGRVAVIHDGRIVEEAESETLFRNPQDLYTRRLIAATPRPDRRLESAVRARTGTTAPLLSASGLQVLYGRHGLLDRLTGRDAVTTGARDVSFDLAPGEVLGVVGESGSGKSTIARALVGLNPFTGRLVYRGRTVTGPTDMNADYRRDVQIVFQHPDASLNPRHSVGAILARPLRLYGLASGRRLRTAVGGLLEMVGLPAAFADRYPHALSGGQKQRVAIARAFASHPKLVICDEITSALDVSVQASVIRLLMDLRRDHGAACLFITHDLNLVRQIAGRVIVMYRGDLVETADIDRLAAGATHPYTRALIDAAPAPVGVAAPD
jgi:peptide/nickel transport system ATP-binding protein